MVAAASSTPPPSGGWRKRPLALFVALAVVGLVAGLIVGFKPESHDAHKTQEGDALSTLGVDPGALDKVVEALSPTTPSTEEAPAPVAPAAPAAPTSPIVPAGADKPLAGLVKNGNTDLLAGLLNAQNKGAASGSSATTQANASSDQPKDKTAFLQSLVKATSVMGAATSLHGGCMPTTGLELREMVEDTSRCTIITLLPGKVYDVALEGKPDDIKVRSRKVIIGNPISMPTIDGSTCTRIFHVMAGGSLDLQFLRTFRGAGELIATIPVLRGGSALVELGGRMSAFGVIFTNALPKGVPAVLIAPDISRAVRVFGGQIYNAGGILTITLSHFFVISTGVLVREIYVVGGDILQVTGVVVLSGCTFTNSQLFLNGLGSGYLVAVLGGVLIGSGVTFTVNMLAINCTGAGIFTFVGGGVAIFSGCTWVANAGALSYFGSGIMIFSNGVLVISGGAMGINLGVGTQIGTGMMISTGGGTFTATGLTQEVSTGVDYTSGSGVFNWNGAGSAVYVGFTQSRSIGVVGVYSIGGNVCQGAGALVVVGAATHNSFGVAGIVAVGTNWFVGAGVMVQIGCPWAINVGVLWATLIGVDGFVGAGTAVVGYSPFAINTGQAFLNKNPSIYVVNGVKVPLSVTNFKVNKDGIVPLGNKNKTRLMLAEGEEAEVVSPAGRSSLTILQGSNVNQGNPSAMVAQLQNSALGAGANPVETVYATVNGEGTTCNACGFEGDLANQFAGEAAGACSNTEGAATACSLPGVQMTREDGTTGPLPAWMIKAAGLFDPSTNKTTLLDSSIVSTTFKVGCSPAGATALTSCLDAAVVANAIKASLPTDCARMNLQAKNAPMHSEIEMQDNVAESFADSAHTDVYDLAFTTHDAACTAQITEWVEGFAPETFLGTLAAPADVKLDATGVALEAVHEIKGMDLAGASKQIFANMMAAVSDTGLPTVLVQGSGSSLGRLALPQVESGSTATVALANFFEDKPVTMELTTKCMMAAAAKDAAVALGSFAPADQLAVTIPAGTAPGTYSLRATQNGLSWCSQPVDIK